MSSSSSAIIILFVSTPAYSAIVPSRMWATIAYFLDHLITTFVANIDNIVQLSKAVSGASWLRALCELPATITG